MEVMKDLVYPWLFAPHIHDQVEEDDDINIKPASHNAYKDDLAHKSEDLNGEFTVALMHYQKPGVHPPGARVEAKPMKLATVKPIPLWQMWKYGLAAATKTTQVTFDVLSHHIWGPRRPSWGIELTVISALMRNAASHSALVSITTIRALMGIGGLVPLPSDAIITPVTFHVKRRKLRGFLQACDEAETGKRELSGEWVVGKRTWQRLQTEWKQTHAGSSTGQKPKARTERVILYIHGGAYYISSAASQRLISIPLAKYTDARVFALDYRLAPESQFPGPVHDVAAGYFRLVEDLNIPPENIVLCGDSAGGGLCLALLQYLRDNAYAMPSGGILICPWVDLTMSCKSWDSNSQFDVVPMPASPDDPLHPVQLYLGANLDKYITHPYASPLFGNFVGLPPLLIQSGDAEVLRDEITLLAHKASLAGVKVRHELYEDAIHVFHFYPFLEAATRAFMSIRDFVRHDLSQDSAKAQSMLDTETERAFQHELEDKDKTMVVRGDGVQVASGMTNVNDELKAESEDVVETSDSDEDLRRKQDEEAPAVWRRNRSSWARGDFRPGDYDSDDDNDDIPETSSRRTETHSQQSTLHRIKDALSLIIPEPPHLPVSIRSPRNHRRARSARGISAKDIPWRTPQTSRSAATSGTSTPRRPPSHIDLPRPESPSLVMRSAQAPSPSIRRRPASIHASHSDLSSLVSDMEKSGPANQTMMFRPSPSAS